MDQVHRLMARLGSKRIWRQWSESAGASADGFPALETDAPNWDEMPQVGSSFHWSLLEDESGDLERLLGPEGALLFRPSDSEGNAFPDGGEAGSAHYY